MGLLEDGQGNIWISTNKGVSRFNPEKMEFKNFTETDGLQSDQFNRWAFLKLPTGELLFGGTNGFNIFNPDAIRDNTWKPPVLITDFKLFNKPVPIGEDQVLKQNVMLTKEIELDWTQNQFSFEFAGLNFRQTEKNQYRYRMVGFQDDWIDAGTERKVFYTNLSPGEYTFEVVASNNDLVWNEKPASILITIVPPFWWTWWFWTIIALAGASAIIGYNRRVKRKAKRQAAELKSVIEERTREVELKSQEILKKAELEKKTNWITQGLATVADAISKNNSNVNSLGKETLRCIVKYVQAQQGVIAMAMKEDENDEHLVVLASYGVSVNENSSQRIEVGSGLLGETYLDKETKVMTSLPKGYLKIESGLGEATATTIVLLPLMTEDGEMVGVMELAFLSTVQEGVVEFLEKISRTLSLNIVAATLSHKTILLLQQSKEQTEEMRAQEEEMRQNMEELEATTEEFRRREIEYQRRIQELEGGQRR
jgi:hypothetical protein